MQRTMPAIALALVLAGLGGDARATPSDLQKARTPFRPVDLKTLKVSTGSNPGAVVYQAIAPGRQRQTGSEEKLTLEFVSTTQAIAVFDLLNLNDRITKDLRYRVELLQQKDRTWAITWMGVRNRCQEGRGGKGWSKTPCK